MQKTAMAVPEAGNRHDSPPQSKETPCNMHKMINTDDGFSAASDHIGAPELCGQPCLSPVDNPGASAVDNTPVDNTPIYPQHNHTVTHLRKTAFPQPFLLRNNLS
jgi:hypothetical protein